MPTCATRRPSHIPLPLVADRSRSHLKPTSPGGNLTPPSLPSLSDLFDAVSTLDLGCTVSTIVVWVPGRTLATICMQQLMLQQRQQLQQRLINSQKLYYCVTVCNMCMTMYDHMNLLIPYNKYNHCKALHPEGLKIERPTLVPLCAWAPRESPGAPRGEEAQLHVLRGAVELPHKRLPPGQRAKRIKAS